jgi:hypothetical protein
MLGWAWCVIHEKCTETRYAELVFESSGIYMSCSALMCICSTKSQSTIFHARVGLGRFHKNRVGTHYTDLVFLHLVGYVGHVVIPVHPRREILTHYFS